MSAPWKLLHSHSLQKTNKRLFKSRLESKKSRMIRILSRCHSIRTIAPMLIDISQMANLAASMQPADRTTRCVTHASSAQACSRTLFSMRQKRIDRELRIKDSTTQINSVEQISLLESLRLILHSMLSQTVRTSATGE